MTIWDDIGNTFTGGVAGFLKSIAELIGKLAESLPKLIVDAEEILRLLADLLKIVIGQLIVLATFFEQEPELSILALFSIFLILVIVIKHA